MLPTGHLKLPDEEPLYEDDEDVEAEAVDAALEEDWLLPDDLAYVCLVSGAV